jgi:integrase
MAKLTVALLGKLYKQGKPDKLQDESCPGLYFKVTGPRAASWTFRYQLNGQRREPGLGRYPALGLAEARDKAYQLRKLACVDKIDPLAHRQAERSRRRAAAASQLTVKQLVEQYANVRKSSWGYWMAYGFRTNFKNHVLPVIGDVLTADVNISLVRQVLDPIWTLKPTLARIIQGDLARLFEYAEFYGLRQGNPARGIQKYLPKQREGSHRKDLPYEEMPQFIVQLRDYQNARAWYRSNVDKRQPILDAVAVGKSFAQIGRDLGINSGTVWWLATQPAPIDFRKLRAYALEFLILTGPPRSAEILATLWRDIDEQQKILVMLRQRMKVKKGGKDDHIIPLSSRALEIIEALKPIRNGDYLFPGSHQGRRPDTRELLTVRTKEPGVGGLPMSRIALISFLRKDLGRDDIDVHGFRKTFTNWAYASGRFRDIAIELCLDHAYGNKIHRIYRDEQLVEERRELLHAWANYCAGESAGVIRLPVRKRKASA